MLFTSFTTCIALDTCDSVLSNNDPPSRDSHDLVRKIIQSKNMCHSHGMCRLWEPVKLTGGKTKDLRVEVLSEVLKIEREIYILEKKGQAFWSK